MRKLFNDPRFHTFLRWALLATLIIIVVVDAFARAGGAGGGSSGRSSGRSSGGSSGGGDLFFLILIFDLIGRLFGFLFATIGPLPTLGLVAAIIIVSVLVGRKKKHDDGNVYRKFQDVGNFETPRRPEGMAAFLKRHPDFDQDLFLGKVRTAFLGIQEAWSKQDLAGVRRFISDGVYQRFSAQFTMMGLLRQQNRLSNIRIGQMRIDRADTDGPYDIIQVAVQASMRDRFVCELNHAFDQEGDESFTEYWSFIRRSQRTGPAGHADASADGGFADIYQSTQCPNCGAQLPADLGERGQCPYCQTMVNSGEYDWVLSEITQSEDYLADRTVDDNSNLKARTAVLRKEDPDFAVQLAEDKASNALMQIMAARALRKPEQMRRFVDDGAWDKLQKSIPSDPIVFNRLYLNRVTLAGVRQDDRRLHLAFAVTMTSQRVRLEGQKVRLLDPALRQDETLLVMSRDRHPETAPKGSLYQHQCANCGAPVSDSLSVTCPYCSQPYNSGAHEWVVSDVLPMADLRAWLAGSSATVTGTASGTGARATRARVNPAVFENMYDVRDFAMNNLMVMIAADGVFADEERAFAEEAARRFGFKIDNMQALFDMAASGRLGLRMPNDVSKREKIIRMMEEVASTDGEIAPEEQKILDYLRSSFISGDFFRF